VPDHGAGGRIAAPLAAASFLPDLCGVRPLFAVVMIGELLVFVLILTRAQLGIAALDELALLSLYVQCVALSAAAVLCLSRPWLSRLPESGAVAASYVLVLAVVAGVAEVAWWILHPAPDGTSLIRASHGDFVLRTLGISAIAAALILRYFYVQFHWQLQTAAEARARLLALQARIRPHFFFNCMNTIASLTRSDPRAAEQAIEDLADLFRASLADGRDLVPLRDEIALSRRYLDIERLRLGPRLAVEWNLASLPATAMIPQLTLQPLVENALYHGIEPRATGGVIRIATCAVDGDLEIVVRNPCIEGLQRHAGNRLAQDNVRQRLQAHFGARGTLRVLVADGEYVATLRVPLPPAA
jgi:two-component system sensor histidine kinase AlgZ